MVYITLTGQQEQIRAARWCNTCSCSLYKRKFGTGNYIQTFNLNHLEIIEKSQYFFHYDSHSVSLYCLISMPVFNIKLSFTFTIKKMENDLNQKNCLINLQTTMAHGPKRDLNVLLTF